MATSHPSARTSAAARNAARMAVVSALPVLQRAYRAAADKVVAPAGLSLALALPLVTVGRMGSGVRPGTLADALAIEAASLVRPLEQLLEAALLERREDAGDRRAKTLHLTAAGQATIEKLETVLLGLRNSVFDGIPDEDIAACLRVFATLESRLCKGHAAPLEAAA